jgi:hypothetical protein
MAEDKQDQGADDIPAIAPDCNTAESQGTVEKTQRMCLRPQREIYAGETGGGITSELFSFQTIKTEQRRKTDLVERVKSLTVDFA